MAKSNDDKTQFINPIDRDKVTENPGTLPYAHTVGSAVIKPGKQGVIRNRSMAAMQQQTDMQLQQIKEQIELLARQAEAIQQRKELSQHIYQARMSFKPEINQLYHLYRNEEGQYVLSMIAPAEWGSRPRFKEFVYSVRLLADHTWDVVEAEAD